MRKICMTLEKPSISPAGIPHHMIAVDVDAVTKHCELVDEWRAFMSSSCRS